MIRGRISGARYLLVPTLSALLAGCPAVGPDYRQPELEAGAGYRAPIPPLVGEADADIAWWTQFDDRVIAELVTIAVAANLDVLLARSRIREAAAQRRSVRSERFPSLDGEAEGDLLYDRVISGSNGGQEDETQGAVAAGAVFGWSADLFGGLRRAEEAAEAEAVRQVWLRQAVALDVAGSVAGTYVDLRGLQRRLELGRDSLELQRRTLEIVRGRVTAGLAPRLNLAQAEAAVAQLRADLAPVQTDIERATDALAILLGQPPSVFSLPVQEGDTAIPVLQAGPPLGAPVNLLRRRPDIRAAEQTLVAATAEIGVAEADFYPELTLPGQLTFTVDGIGTGDIVRAVVGSLSAVLDIPLFDAGGRTARLDAAEARAMQALLIYRSTLLTALQEVEGAMYNYAGLRERLAALDLSVDANRRAFEQARALFNGGLVNFIDVLDSQRELTSALQQRAETQADLTIAAIELYRAAGFGPCVPDDIAIDQRPYDCV